jgi:hypothetical protein
MIALPVGLITFLVAIAPPMPERPKAVAQLLTAADGQPFRYLADQEAYALDFDPRQVGIDLLEGWDREQEAYADSSALAFVSGPMYERHVDAQGRELTVPLGDLKLGERVWRGINRTAARQRAFLGIRNDGGVEFGYGELTAERSRRYDTFIGGLHSIYNDLEQPPPQYKGAYSISMGQQIRYFLPRIRMLFGLRADGRLEVLMSRDGLTLEQTRALARSRGLRAAYLPDHASKSRFIIPGEKGFSNADANWISGGATSFVHVPYMLRLSRRSVPLRGSLLAGLALRNVSQGCGNPFQCGQTLGGQLVDRVLAGFNRLMEQGVEPLARLFWAPRGSDPHRSNDKAPLREPPISADPLALRERQRQDNNNPASASEPPEPLKLPDDLSAPVILPQGTSLPALEASPAEVLEPENRGTANPQGGPAPGPAPTGAAETGQPARANLVAPPPVPTAQASSSPASVQPSPLPQQSPAMPPPLPLPPP